MMKVRLWDDRDFFYLKRVEQISWVSDSNEEILIDFSFQFFDKYLPKAWNDFLFVKTKT